mgnify:CR=1 FL=1
MCSSDLQLTKELSDKVSEAMQEVYRRTAGPLDQRAARVADAVGYLKADLQATYLPNTRRESTPELDAQQAQNFNNFCQLVMGTDNLYELLKKKWAFRGRANNSSSILKEPPLVSYTLIVLSTSQTSFKST